MNKLVVMLIVVAITAVVMANWGIDRLFSQTQEQQTQAAELTQTFIQQLGQSLAVTLSRENDPQAYVQTLQQPGLDLSVQHLTEVELPTALEQMLLQQNYLLLESEQSLTYIFSLNKDDNFLLITRPILPTTNNAQLQLVFTLLFYLCIAGTLIIWSRPLIKRLITLRQTTQAFGEGDLQQRISTGPSFYIGDIEKEFNRMADRIETLIADNKLLSNAVSHDLKTPLARLRFGIDVLHDTDDTQQRQKYLAKVNRDLQEMEALVDTLLCYARLDQAKLELHHDKIDIVEFINELTATIDSHNVEVLWAPPPTPHYVIGDKRYLSLLINNLVANACQHAKQSIAIHIDTLGETTRLLIEDDGPGIPLAQRQAVLKPFIRGEHSRSSPGHGMGLAIVNRITQWHHWRLAINDSKQLGGTQVEVTIS